MTRTSARADGWLPAELTSLIGRQAETADVRALLTKSRLVTLTGPGGVGKTRLSINVARQAAAAFPDGVWMVPLAELTEPELLAPTVLARLGKVGGTGTSTAELAAFIDGQQLLLVLDNCEHLTAAVADLVVDVLGRCPHLAILATSREALRVSGEALYAVPPLALPESGQTLPPGAARTYDGVALFLERASMLNRGFTLDEAGESAVVSLCRRVDGLPLAIELAASGTRWLSIESMTKRAGDPLTALPTGNRGVPGRHQSLRASLDYSRDLCSTDAQLLWDRMSVFRGSVTMTAIEEICAGDHLEPQAVAPALFELVDKSLVRLEGSRYRMLETIRQYGGANLEADEQVEVYQRRHLRYYADSAADLAERWFGPPQSELLNDVLEDQANVRTALEHALAPGGDASAGLRMAADLWPFWIGCGFPGEGRHWLGRLLAAGSVDESDLAFPLWVASFLTLVDGDVPTARRMLEECARLAEKVGDASTAAHVSSVSGLADLWDGDFAGAVSMLEAAVEHERAVQPDGPFVVDAMLNLGHAYCYAQDLVRADEVLQEAVAICETKQERLFMAWGLDFLGLVRILDSRPAEAEVFVRQAMTWKRHLHYRQGIMWSVELAAWAALGTGETERAAVLLGAIDERSSDFGPSFHGFRQMLEKHRDSLAKARTALGDKAYSQAVAKGRRLSVDEMVSFALSEQTETAETSAGTGSELPLTRREGEIARLIASGKTNREIAAELVIAQRTVDTHVQNILTKLGFTSRSQVAALLGSTSRMTDGG